MANISSNKQGKKSMAEYKDTGDTPNTEKTFSPVYSYSQKISNLIAEGKITAPKYRTLSQEQMTTYYTAKDLPDYDMQKIKAGIKNAQNTNLDRFKLLSPFCPAPGWARDQRAGYRLA